MRKIKLFTVMAAVMIIGLTSCSKNEGGTVEPGDKAYINLIFPSEVTRAPGDAEDAKDVKIENLAIFILAGNTVIDQHYVTTGVTTALATTNNATHVFVVANAGNVTNLAVSSLAKLKALTANLDATPAPAGTPGVTAAQVAEKVMMTSEDVVALSAFTTATPPTATASVNLKFVGAKVIVQFKDATDGTDDTSLTKNIADWTFHTFVHRANGIVPFLGTAAERSVLGATLYSAITKPGVTTAAYLLDPSVVDIVTPVFPSPSNHYYLFGNDAATDATIVGITGLYIKTTGNSMRYFPLHFNPADAGKTLEPGNVYFVTLSLKGDFTDPNGPGVPDPDDEIIPGTINVTITTTPWNARIIINKEI